MLKVAVLDLYDGTQNRGIPSLKAILDGSALVQSYALFDVRAGAQLPGLEYDLYISSGGPGDPLSGDGIWDKAYFDLIDRIIDHNRVSQDKKYLFLICHSFQMLCHHLQVGEVIKRKSRSFGTFPCHKTKAGTEESTLAGLDDPFWVADFRNYQVVRLDQELIKKNNYRVLCIEKERPHVPLERATMGIRFSDEIIGYQFHPEANPRGMLFHFEDGFKMQELIEHYGEEKYIRMIADLKDPHKIKKTYNTIIPTFINNCYQQKTEFGEVVFDQCH